MNLTPKTSAARVDHVVIEKYLEALFGDYDWQEGEGLCLRGLNEKGVVGGKHFAENAWVRADGGGGGFGSVEPVGIHTERWCEHGHGAFMVPAVVRAGNPGDGAKDADVIAYTSLCLDLDNPEHSEAARASIEFAIGPASMVVESSPGKLHLYWLFNEPETDTAKVARMRHILALKTGGDPAFQRLPQVIRIPGSIHGKGGVKSEVTLLHCDPDCRHSFEFLAERIEEMFPLPFAAAAAPKELARVGGAAGGGLKFTPDTSAGPSAPGEIEVAGGALTQTVREGGADGITRHDQFNKAAGHYIHCVRVGEMTLAEARAGAEGWALTHQVPPWSTDVFEGKWQGLLKHDISANGALVHTALLTNRAGIQAPDGAKPSDAKGIYVWAAHRWVDPNNIPVRKWIVGGKGTGLVRVGASHVLAAEGGVGKTFALLELAMKIAAPRPGDLWLGQPLDPRHTNKTAIVITAEDDKDELHIRMMALDPDGSRVKQAGDKLLIIPLLQAGGAFQLADERTGRVSPAWQAALDTFATIPDLALVAIDTLAATLHGEENAALVLQQYISALNMVQGVCPGCATMVTHHVRKADPKAQVLTAADMRLAIRGSNALLGAVRMVIGVWQPSNWRSECKRLGRPEEQGTVFNMAVVKANNSEALSGERVVVRAPTGALVDITDEAAKLPEFTNESKAWFLAAVSRAVDEGRAYGRTGANGAGETRHPQLPAGVGVGMGKTQGLIKELIREGRLFEIPTGKLKGLLEVRGGPLTLGGVGYQDQGVVGIPDWTGWKYHSLTDTILPPSTGIDGQASMGLSR